MLHQNVCILGHRGLNIGEGLSAVDLVLICRDQLRFILEILFTFFYKTTYLNEEVKYTEPSPQLVLPG